MLFLVFLHSVTSFIRRGAACCARRSRACINHGRGKRRPYKFDTSTPFSKYLPQPSVAFFRLTSLKSLERRMYSCGLSPRQSKKPTEIFGQLFRKRCTRLSHLPNIRICFSEKTVALAPCPLLPVPLRSADRIKHTNPRTALQMPARGSPR